MVQATTTGAMRNSKNLTKAFFAAAEEIELEQRAGAMKDAYAAIREQMKTLRLRAKTAKAKAGAKKAKRGPAVRAGRAGRSTKVASKRAPAPAPMAHAGD